MSRTPPMITISADVGGEIEGSSNWPVRITLRKAYAEVCSVSDKFSHDSPKSALLGALQSGTIRAKASNLIRTTRWDNCIRTYREFSEDYISIEEWAKCSAFNPLESAMNYESGAAATGIEVYSMDLCHWLSEQGEPYHSHFAEYGDVELALAENREREIFDDKYVLSRGRLRQKRRGAPTEHDWAKAVAHVLLARLHQRGKGQEPYKQADWARRLQEALGEDGGPADSTSNQYASLIIDAIKYWNRHGADFDR
jgi:hypothetical protein